MQTRLQRSRLLTKVVLVGKVPMGKPLIGKGGVDWHPSTVGIAEIVYPCIPDPDGDDEGGQGSSSLAVSIRWISIVKLLQSDLATLAQRERGE
ncbi:hypothetical protein B296_00002499 [Ensete ventricosum]|uniref:Uncharacterized protein n=1 Tax=Ensete ventricosum TaxID=4639 RepID=A0A426YEQ4_ENSVE|nr:hypothetical protein B296_00002499 [Ensete ventricosum]